MQFRSWQLILTVLSLLEVVACSSKKNTDRRNNIKAIPESYSAIVAPSTRLKSYWFKVFKLKHGGLLDHSKPGILNGRDRYPNGASMRNKFEENPYNYINKTNLLRLLVESKYPSFNSFLNRYSRTASCSYLFTFHDYVWKSKSNHGESEISDKKDLLIGLARAFRKFCTAILVSDIIRGRNIV